MTRSRAESNGRTTRGFDASEADFLTRQLSEARLSELDAAPIDAAKTRDLRKMAD
jgi:hypothetical protein